MSFDIPRDRKRLKSSRRLIFAGALVAGLWGATAQAELPRIRVGPDHRSFVVESSGETFVPWGFNYDHDHDGRLLEDYWHTEWPAIEEDFAEMQDLGANVVRIHLQFGRFMNAPGEPNQDSLDRLTELLQLAERSGLYLDLTGLGCYHKQDVPAWYDALDERGRWQAQAAFWEAIAQRGAKSSAVFCYDLMNEPVVPGGRREAGQWLGPPFAGKHFVQFITLDQQDRPRAEIAQRWTAQLVRAIRRHDSEHLVTVGLVPWSLDRPGLTSGFVPERIVEEVDFIAVHLYPERAKLDEAFVTLRGFDVGKPVLVEETFPLKCSNREFEKFLIDSRRHAAGWIGFYWGTSPAELAEMNTIAAAMMRGYLATFKNGPPRAELSRPDR